MKLEHFKTELLQASDDSKSIEAEKLLELIKDVEAEIFQGKEEPQPLKWYQFERIYKLAKACIEILVIIIPYIRVLIKWIK